MSEYTKGAWHIDENGKLKDELGNLILPPKGFKSFFHADKRQANCNLIAAAPDLLAECERTQSELISALNDPSHITPDMLRRWLNGVESVINKATGKE